MFKTAALMALSRVTEIPGRALNEPSSVCRSGCCDSHAGKCWAVEVPQEMVVLHHPCAEEHSALARGLCNKGWPLKITLGIECKPVFPF